MGRQTVSFAALRQQLSIEISALAVILVSGCTQPPNAGHGDIKDYVFGRRHTEAVAHAPGDSALVLARQITALEDDLRRDGTITIKHPDVWGDANLVHYIQEHDRLLQEKVGSFTETVQAYLARSDQMEGAATLALSQGLGSTPAPSASASTLGIETTGLFTTLDQALGTGQPPPKGVGLEPTELERQRSTFILINQALRRRNSGDDNSRAAGYGLYKFRVPVSVLPGRETSEGHSAVVSLRARLEVDAAHLKFTFPKLVVADLVEDLEPVIAKAWGQPTVTEEEAKLAKVLAAIQVVRNEACSLNDQTKIATQLSELLERATTFSTDAVDSPATLDGHVKLLVQAIGKTRLDAHALQQAPKLADAIKNLNAETSDLAKLLAQTGRSTGPAASAVGIPIRVAARGDFQGQASINALRAAAQQHFLALHGAAHIPATQELRAFLFDYLAQVHKIIEARGLYDSQREFLDAATQFHIKGNVIQGGNPGDADFRFEWIRRFRASHGETSDPLVASVSWLVAFQSAILDANLKSILDEQRLRSGAPGTPPEIQQLVHFYSPLSSPEPTLELWRRIITEEFPLYVFTLDPQVEEQNAYDAFSRRRELQLALAYGVASGNLNANSALKLSRQLTFEQETIALNRTVVGFNHGRDTFGWYFHPRIQSPPVESSNIAAAARLLWSTGPTDHYDKKHRRLEPGIRECEVLVAMPSFVSGVAFDVTTNWELLVHPGKTKRSYEEMLAQGGRLHQLQCQLRAFSDEQCLRPGDSARLVSRLEQLEHMLGMQTFQVRVPYEYEQSGADLFDKGDIHLRPVVHDFYGLSFVDTVEGKQAQFFVEGKNFHPTLTHVIVGGVEAHRAGNTQDIEVISREVLQVTIKGLNPKLSRDHSFEIRVATPAGISNPVIIPSKQEVKSGESPKKSDFDWASPPTYPGHIRLEKGEKDKKDKLKFQIYRTDDKLKIVNNTSLPVRSDGELHLAVEAKLKDGSSVALGRIDRFPASRVKDGFEVEFEGDGLEEEIREIVIGKVSPTQEVTQIVVNTWIRLDAWPFVKFNSPLVIEIGPVRIPAATP